MSEFVRAIQGLHALCIGEPQREAPPGWQWLRLGELARLESGHTPSRNKPEYWDGDVGWVSIRDARVHHGEYIVDTIQTITEAGLANSSARLLPKDTVCLSRTASVGYVFILGREMATSQDFVNWVCSDALVPRFLQYLFIAEGDDITRFGKGTTHTTIYFEAAEEFRVCMPPVPEQRRIVAKLDELLTRSRRAREALAEVPALVARYRESVLAAAFRGDLTADWREANPAAESASALLERIRVERRRRWEEAEHAKLTAKGKAPKDDRWKERYSTDGQDSTHEAHLPAGWCSCGIGELCEFITDGDHNPPVRVASGVPHLTAKNIKRRSLLFDGCSFVTEEGYAQTRQRYEPMGGDVIITCVGTVGETAVVPSGVRFSADRNLAALRPIPVAGLAVWIENLLNAPPWRARLLGASGSTAQPHLYLSDLRALVVPLAPLAEQREIVRRVEAAFARIDAVEAAVAEQRARLDAYDRSLLARAFAGELVPQDPADEPAATLLARLRAERGEAAPARGRRRRG